MTAPSRPVRRTVTRLAAGALLASVPIGCRQDEPAPPAKVTFNAAPKEYVSAALLYQTGDREAALTALKRTVQDNPDLIMARYYLGNIYRDKELYGDALEQYRRVAELDPHVAQNHYNVGLMCHLLDRLQDAAASYTRALRAEPGDFKSNMNLGLVYTALGRAKEGAPFSRRATQVEPRSAEAWANLGVVLDAAGDYAGAENAYKTAIELDAGRIETLMNYAASLMAQRRPEAAGVYGDVLKRISTPLLHERHGQALLLAGRIDEAIRAFDSALRMDPRSFPALTGLGDAALAQYKRGAELDESKRTAAIDFWRRSLAMNPNQPRVKAQIQAQESGGPFSPR